MTKPEQYDTIPDYTEAELAQARQLLEKMLDIYEAGVLGFVLHQPAGTPGFYAAGATLVAQRHPQYPADFLYARIMTFRDMRKAGYGLIEICGIMEDNFKAFLEGTLNH